MDGPEFPFSPRISWQYTSSTRAVIEGELPMYNVEGAPNGWCGGRAGAEKAEP